MVVTGSAIVAHPEEGSEEVVVGMVVTVEDMEETEEGTVIGEGSADPRQVHQGEVDTEDLAEDTGTEAAVDSEDGAWF